MKGVFLACVLVALFSNAIASSSTPQKPRSTPRTIQVGELQRSYRLYVPRNLPDGPIALVIVFHGGGGGAVGVEVSTRFSDLADREHFIVAYPEGYKRNWNDGRAADVSDAHRKKIDDVAFVAAMIDAISKEYPIDPKRVFATGISNGAIFSHYLAANLSQRIAAIAPVAGGIADPFHKRFKPAEPVSVLILQGTQDPLVPFDGGEVAWGRGEVIPTGDAVELWAERNGSWEDAQNGTVPDRNPDDGCTVTWSSWTNPGNGVTVVLYTLEGAGHTWPGGPQYLSERVIGKVCRDLDGTEVIWDFFKRHPKP